MRDRGQGTKVPITLRSGRTAWRVAVSMPDGSRIWRQRLDERAADRALRDLIDMRETGLDPTRRTLTAFLRSWMAELAASGRVRPTTLRFYRFVIEQHVIPGLDKRGRLQLRALTEEAVQRWIDGEAGKPQTRRHYHAVLRRALNVAVRRHYVARNVALGVELPARPPSAGKPLTADEAHRLLLVTADDRLHALWRLAIVTGLRESELLGLGWDDLDGDLLTITGQLQRIGRSWVRSPTKAARTLRAIALDPATVDVIAAHRRAMAEEREPSWRYHGLMFTTPAGEPYHGKAVLDALKDAYRRAGITPRRMHDLRHTNQTLMEDAGVPELHRMARAGQVTPEANRRYTLPSQEQDRAAVALLARRIG